VVAAGVPAVAQGAPAPSEIRLAVVDMDRVMAESEMGKMEQVGIDRLKGERTALIAAKQKELDAMEEQIRNASLSWSDEKREDQSRQFEVKRVELRRLNEDATRDVQAEFNHSMTKLQKAALGVTGTIGREKGYTLVLEKNTVPVLFASDSIEITDDVIRRLNSSKGADAAPKAPGAPVKPATNPPKPGGGR
ncbi:MAG TPA: OmpH family outer membrane protein, partial [Verrucomicrobiae bacterium]|nr:OmpH family outer membrane protein [Verrucomicrobiae bacterium]